MLSEFIFQQLNINVVTETTSDYNVCTIIKYSGRLLTTKTKCLNIYSLPEKKNKVIFLVMTAL